MLIGFEKITATPKPILLEVNGITLSGNLEQVSRGMVALDGKIFGKLSIVCDRCGASFDFEIEQKLDLNLTDKVSQNKDDLDIIEFLDGAVDITYIIESEVNALKSAYHYCNKCEGVEDFEIEI